MLQYYISEPVMHSILTYRMVVDSVGLFISDDTDVPSADPAVTYVDANSPSVMSGDDDMESAGVPPTQTHPDDNTAEDPGEIWTGINYSFISVLECTPDKEMLLCHICDLELFELNFEYFCCRSFNRSIQSTCCCSWTDVTDQQWRSGSW